LNNPWSEGQINQGKKVKVRRHQWDAFQLRDFLPRLQMMGAIITITLDGKKQDRSQKRESDLPVTEDSTALEFASGDEITVSYWWDNRFLSIVSRGSIGKPSNFKTR
jgi:hypothetical protein